MKRAIILGLGALLGIGTGLVLGAEAASVTDGIYTEEQAERGEAIYQVQCASCHGPDLVSVDPDAPSLTGPGFVWGWQNRTLAERKARIQTSMPPGAGNTLSDQETLDIIAFVLQGNGYPEGEAELTPDQIDLDEAVIAPLP